MFFFVKDIPMANRDDVARRAGVSGATVSRVFNRPEVVDPATAALVRRVAATLGYRPDKNAGALRRQGTGVLIFLEYHGKGPYFWPELRFFNWLYADILRGVVQAVSETPFRLELRSIASLKELSIIAGDCDGILAFNTEDKEYASAVAETGLPYVCAHHTETLTGFSRCSTNNFMGGKLLGNALHSSAYRKVVYVSGYLHEVEAHRQRLSGFREGFGGDVPLVETRIGIDGGMAAARSLAGEVRSGNVNAICAVNDLTALGILRALEDCGIRVPEECLVAGYDNLPVDMVLPYKFPSVDLQLGKLYGRAVAGLADFILRRSPCDFSLDPVLVPGCLLDPPESSS